MNTKLQAIQKISSFLKGTNQTLLLTGTHQKMKHPLVLELVLSKYPAPATILFRTNNLKILGETLGLDRDPKIGKPISVQRGFTLFPDTIKRTTWQSSPRSIDIAIVYPIDSLKFDAGGECIQDLMHRGVKKIFLVSWTDNVDFSWTEYFNPVHVIYDAEEEDSEYHERMMEHVSVRSGPDLPSLPAYAASTPIEYLVQIWCRGKCLNTRWAKLNLPYPGEVAIRKAELGKFRAKCLKCGYEAVDNSNWSR